MTLMRISWIAIALIALSGCRGGTSENPPVIPIAKIVEHHVVPVTNMTYQPKAKAQAGSDFWPDGRSSRMPPEHTIARNSLKLDSAFFRGVDAEGKPVEQYPVEVTTGLV